MHHQSAFSGANSKAEREAEGAGDGVAAGTSAKESCRQLAWHRRSSSTFAICEHPKSAASFIRASAAEMIVATIPPN